MTQTTAGSTVHTHVRFETDAESTRAHLRTADALGLRKVGFWTWRGPTDTTAEPLFDAVYSWTGREALPSV